MDGHHSFQEYRTRLTGLLTLFATTSHCKIDAAPGLIFSRLDFRVLTPSSSLTWWMAGPGSSPGRHAEEILHQATRKINGLVCLSSAQRAKMQCWFNSSA
jgi:hypothetical protein